MKNTLRVKFQALSTRYFIQRVTVRRLCDCFSVFLGTECRHVNSVWSGERWTTYDVDRGGEKYMKILERSSTRIQNENGKWMGEVLKGRRRVHKRRGRDSVDLLLERAGVHCLEFLWRFKICVLILSLWGFDRPKKFFRRGRGPIVWNFWEGVKMCVIHLSQFH